MDARISDQSERKTPYSKKKDENHPNVGSLVLIKGEEKNRNKWKIGKVVRLIRGRDQVVRGVQLQTGKGTIERPIQLIYPALELQCDVNQHKQLDSGAKEFKPRRQAAAVAETVNEVLMEYETEQ